jgi:hypothetical protein
VEVIKETHIYCRMQKYMKGADRANQYLCYNSVLRKTIMWFKNIALCSLEDGNEVGPYLRELNVCKMSTNQGV